MNKKIYLLVCNTDDGGCFECDHEAFNTLSDARLALADRLSEEKEPDGFLEDFDDDDSCWEVRAESPDVFYASENGGDKWFDIEIKELSVK